MKTPQGIEQLLALAGTGPEWRAKVLADPLAAAREAGIELADSERSILASTPREQIERMADSLARRPGGVAWGKVACGAIACAAATGLAGTCLLSMTVTTGIRSDLPRPRLNLPDEGWLTSLDEALAQAKASNRAVMAVFPHPAPRGPKHISYADGGGAVEVGPEWRSQRVIDSQRKESRAAAGSADLITARVAQPTSPLEITRGGATEAEQRLVDHYKETLTAHEAALGKYGLDEGKLPTVLFLAPDGSELGRLVRPEDETKLLEAIEAVPALLVKWRQDRRASEGAVRTAGVRPDVPEKR